MFLQMTVLCNFIIIIIIIIIIIVCVCVHNNFMYDFYKKAKKDYFAVHNVNI